MARSWIFGVLILLVGKGVFGQWYTDPHNPVPVYGPVSESGGLMADLNGGAYFFIYGPYESAMMSHVNVEGQWSCPLPGVVIGPAYSGWAHTEVLDPDNNLIAHGTNVNPFLPETPSELNKWSPTGTPLWETFIFPDTLTRPYQMVSDEVGGCIIRMLVAGGQQPGWYIQRFNESGQPQFGWTERPLAGSTSATGMVSDGVGGGFAIWPLLRDSIRIVQMQHIRPDGSFAFSDSGVTVLEDIYSLTSTYPSCESSFILRWRRVQPQNEYFFTRIDSTGAVIWDFIYSGSWYVFPDNLGGLYFFQEDTAYSRINSLGELVFSGHLLAPWLFSFDHMCISPGGEFFVLHWDEDNEFWTLQKYDSLGIQVWEEPVPVLYNMPAAYCEGLVADSRGGTILYFSQQTGTYFTRVDAYGNVGSSAHVNEREIVLTRFEISAFPNPFNSYINLSWTTNIGGTKQLYITNLLGQRVLSTQFPACTSRFIWDGRNVLGTPVSSGVYYVTLRTEQTSQSLKTILIK